MFVPTAVFNRTSGLLNTTTFHSELYQSPHSYDHYQDIS